MFKHVDDSNSLDDLQQLLNESGSCCAICGTPGDFDSLVVDCDSNRNIRGFLCCRCKSGLELCGDDSKILRNLAKYLTSKKQV